MKRSGGLVPMNAVPYDAESVLQVLLLQYPGLINRWRPQS